MRIGELLVEQRKLRQSDLARALAEKPGDKRTCSFLIARGLVDFDDASRALGEQKGVPCALAKHLAGRDVSLASLIPAELGRASCALPIGRTSQGAVIVCVRDPAPAVLSALRQATSAEIMMVIAPAMRLEHLVLDAYGAAPSDEFDVDFTTGVDSNPTSPAPVSARLELDPKPEPPLPDMDALDPESVRLALADLDDVRVDKDPSQSGRMERITTPPAGTPASATTPPAGTPRPPSTPPPTRVSTSTPPSGAPRPPSTPPPTRVSTSTPPSGTPRPPSTPPVTRIPASTPPAGTPRAAIVPPRRAQTADPRATRPMSLGAMSVGLEHTASREGATDLVLAYVATRWRSGLVLAIRDRSAIGYRGHGVSMPELVALPLDVASTVARAVETRFVTAESPASAAQDSLVHALGSPSAVAAAPVVVNGQPVAVIVVGDPIDAETTLEASAADLGMLGEALSSAYQRIMAR